jgi:hypothetical protein
MGRPFSKTDAEQFIRRLAQAVECNPSSTTAELAASLGASAPTIRKYRRFVQGIGYPRRSRLRLIRAQAEPRHGQSRRRPPQPIVPLYVAQLEAPLEQTPSFAGNAATSGVRRGDGVASTQMQGEVDSENVALHAELTVIREGVERLLAPPEPPESKSAQRWAAFRDCEEGIYRYFRSIGGVPLDWQAKLLNALEYNFQMDRLDKLRGLEPCRDLPGSPLPAVMDANFGVAPRRRLQAGRL